jgi:hypothetical protein
VDEILSWWQSLSAETHVLAQNACIAVLGLVAGHFLGVMVARYLRGRNFDRALRLPGGASAGPATAAPGTGVPPGPEAEHGITPTFIAGWLVRLTVWAAAAWWLTSHNGRADLAQNLAVIIGRTWMLAALVVGALGLGGLLASRLVDCFPAGGAGQGVSPRSAAGAVGAAVYAMVTILVLLMAADAFDWPLTRSSAQALWSLTHNLLVACAALLIGSLGARWARDLATAEPGATPEKRAGQYTALGITAATTLLAVAVLLSSAGVLLGLMALVLLAVLLYLVRGYLPDVFAGLQLRAHGVREVWFDGVAWQVVAIGFLTTQVGRNGDFHRVQNRVVLGARMHAAPSEAAPR